MPSPRRATLMLLGLLCCASAARAGPAAHRTRARAAVPTDAELVADGARIGRIIIITKPIFDLSNPKEDNWLYRTADRLHIRTRASAIRAQLLFHSGERYSPRLIAETERNIRLNLSFVRLPRIRPIAWHNGIVDLEVVTHDVWTLQPAISYSRQGGANSVQESISDENFLGLGKSLSFGHGQDIDRRYTYVQWSDPDVWGSRWTDNLQYSYDSDGSVWQVAVEHPFYSLETRHAGGVLVGDNHSVLTRYSLGEPYDAYDTNSRTDDLHYGRALLISKVWTERLTLGWRLDQSTFRAAPGRLLRAPLPANRKLSYPYVRMHWVQNHFTTTYNLQQIGFPEDVNYGLELGVGLGWATPAFGADRTALIGDVDASYGWRLPAQQELFLTSHLYARLQPQGLRDALAEAVASYFIATSARTKFAVRMTLDASRHLDGDHYFQLGGDTGLRGYPLRYQTGDGLALLTLEERLYTHWFPFRLFYVGAAAFFDAGRTWGHALVPVPQLGVLRDAGIGLRLGNARSAFGNVIHVDLAAPLNDTPHISRLEFLVSTQQSF